MKDFTCVSARRRLDAYHDQELPVADQIAMDAHFEWCDGCAAALADVRLVRSAVRSMAHVRPPLTADDAASLQAAVVTRVKAEREASFLPRVRRMFDDLHLVYAGLGAAGATIACVIVMLGMMRFATIARPDSLAAMVELLASPGSNDNPVMIDGRVTLPRVLDGSFSNGGRAAEEDTVFALAAVVTREGKIANLELLHGNEDDAKLVEGLLNAVSRARFEPASVAGLPVAVNMVWLVAHTTVRASSKHTIELPALPPTVKKRAAQLNTGRVVVA
jgi:hypothetical protein